MTPKTRAVVMLVANSYGVDTDAVIGRVGTKGVTEARHVTWWLLRTLPGFGYTYQKIGDLFDGRNPSSICHAIRSLEGRRGMEPAFGRHMDRVAELVTVRSKGPTATSELREHIQRELDSIRRAAKVIEAAMEAYLCPTE